MRLIEMARRKYNQSKLLRT